MIICCSLLVTFKENKNYWASRSLIKIGSSLKAKVHNKVKLAKISDTHSTYHASLYARLHCNFTTPNSNVVSHHYSVFVVDVTAAFTTATLVLLSCTLLQVLSCFWVE